MAKEPPYWLDEAAAMRRSGKTLQDIGDKLGLTRERVRQSLQKHLGTTSSAELANPEAEGYARHDSEVFEGILTASTVELWGTQGHVATKRFGAARYYLVEDVLAYFMAQMERPCAGPDCDNTVDSLKASDRYCHTCSTEVRRYDYPFMSAEQRAVARLRNDGWRARNPEKAYAISLRAGRKWREKKKRRKALEALVSVLVAVLERRAAEVGFVGYLNTEEGQERFPEGRFPGKMSD